MAGFFESMLPGATSIYGYDKLMDSVKDDKNLVGNTVNNIESSIKDYGTFQPWSVKSGLGTAGFNPTTGQMDYNLSPQQQMMQQFATSGASNFYTRALQDPAGRETDIYNRIRAMQMPEEQRAYDQMNSGLFSSGRGGIATDAYGGTPEQMAFQKAQADARNAASLSSMTQAQNEMMNYGNLGNAMWQNQYSPYTALQNMTGQGLTNQQMRTQAGGNLAQMLSDLGLGELGTQLNYSNLEGNMFGDMIQAGSGLAAGAGSALDGLWKSIFGGKK